jgi:hypothetical protein
VKKTGTLIILLVSFISIASILFACSVQSKKTTAEEREVYEKLSSLNQMREALASSLDHRTEPIDESTFKVTCMPVGKELMRWAKEKGYQAKQISHKNRNPHNAISEKDQEVYSLFLVNSEKKSYKKTLDPASQQARFFYHIPYVSSCNHCHGTKESRPEFVKNKYPDDKAYDFREGDLRGVYVVE